jgi:predicted RNA-binding Zn-ribbon protein involved in translation (DUF1610 family)
MKKKITKSIVKTETITPPFDVGDRVTSAYHSGDEKIIRKITQITRDTSCGSGWRVSSDWGEPCPTCGRGLTRNISGADSAWFKRVVV